MTQRIKLTPTEPVAANMPDGVEKTTEEGLVGVASSLSRTPIHAPHRADDKRPVPRLFHGVRVTVKQSLLPVPIILFKMRNTAPVMPIFRESAYA